MAADDIENAAKKAGRKAEHSSLLDRAIRAGLVCYGVLHLLLGWLMLQLALGSGGTEVDQSGALKELAGQPFGRVLLAVVGLGFVALVLWQLIEALGGHRREQGFARAVKRLVSVGRMAVYGYLAGSALKIAVQNSSGGGDRVDSLSARLMEVPFGPVIVAGVGVAAIGYAVGTVIWALSRGFEKNLERRGVAGAGGRAVGVLAKVGYIARASAFLLVGSLFVWAAVTRDPERSGGLDEALSRLLGEPFGPVLLTVMAAGFACFSLYCLAWARYLDR